MSIFFDHKPDSWVIVIFELYDMKYLLPFTTSIAVVHVLLSGYTAWLEPLTEVSKSSMQVAQISIFALLAISLGFRFGMPDVCDPLSRQVCHGGSYSGLYYTTLGAPVNYMILAISGTGEAIIALLKKRRMRPTVYGDVADASPDERSRLLGSPE